MSRRIPAILAVLVVFIVAVVGSPPLAASPQEPATGAVDTPEAEPSEEVAAEPRGDEAGSEGDGFSDEDLAKAKELFASVGLTVEKVSGLRALADQIDSPQVGPVVDLGRAITVGRGTFRPRAGTSVRLLRAGGVPAGVVIDGPGRLEYAVEDRFSIPIAQRNLGEGASLTSAMKDGALVIGTDFDAAAVWSWALGAEAARHATEGGEPGSLPPALRKSLDTALFGAPSTFVIRGRHGSEAHHASASEAGNSIAGATRAYALAVGGSENLLLTVDPKVTRQESLDVVTGVSRYNTVQAGLTTLFGIVSQPIGRNWWDRQGSRDPLVLEHQAISLVNDQRDHVRSESTSRVRARVGGVSLWRAAVSSYFYWDEKLHPVSVEKVLLDGKPADYLHRDHTLLVDLGRELDPGDTVELTVVIEGDMAKRPNNDSYWQPVASWRPSMGLDGEFSTYDITVRTPDPYLPFASGDTVERREEDGFHVLHSRVEKPAHFPVVVAGRYKVFSDEKNGYTCNVATYVFGKERGAKVLQGLFFTAAQVFEQFFGVPYPFKEVDIVEMNSWGWGQAPDGVIFITQEAYNPIGDTISRYYSQGVNARFVHEVAHAWWGHVIKMDSWEEQWLTESFADYSAALAMKVMQPGKQGEREFNRILREWRSVSSQVGAGGSIYLANYLDSRDPTDVDNGDRYRLLYNKGPLVLHALRQELGRRLGSAEKGDKYFQALLRTFTTNFTNQYGETRHLVGILNQMTGDDWQPWFEKYVYGTETPEVEI